MSTRQLFSEYTLWDTSLMSRLPLGWCQWWHIGFSALSLSGYNTSLTQYLPVDLGGTKMSTEQHAAAFAKIRMSWWGQSQQLRITSWTIIIVHIVPSGRWGCGAESKKSKSFTISTIKEKEAERTEKPWHEQRWGPVTSLRRPDQGSGLPRKAFS